jgi:hypothetical protein
MELLKKCPGQSSTSWQYFSCRKIKKKGFIGWKYRKKDLHSCF